MNLINLWMLAGAWMALLFAAGHLVSGQPLKSRWPLVVLFLSVAVVQIAWWFARTGCLERHPVILWLHYPALFLIGPCVLLFSRMVRQERGWTADLAWHFLPAGVSVVYASTITWVNGGVSRMPDAWPVALSSALGACYVGQLAWRLRRRPRRDVRQQLQVGMVALFALLGAGVAVAALSGRLLASEWFYTLYLSMMTALMLLVWLASARFPDWFYHIADVPAVPEPARSQLGNVDLQRTLTRLRQCMDEEQVWRDESLSLASLAGHVGISPHQLSELLNVHLGQTFSRHLKTYRVDEAARRLLNEPDTPILDIGLAAGFNSSSAFYAAFRELRGVAPGQYRRRGGATDD